MQEHRRHSAAALGLTATLCLAACGGADTTQPAASTSDTITITDAQDRTVELPLVPEVVVATDWSVIRTLNDLGVEVDAVPAFKATLPDDLAAYAGDDVPKVGTVQEPDYEAISALEPDVVIVGSRSGTPEVVAELEKITPKVVDMSVRWDDPVEQLDLAEQRITELGALFGLEQEAQEQVDAVRSKIEQIAARTSEAGDQAMFVQVSGVTASAYGPGSRFGVVYEAFGYADTGAPVDAKGSHGQEISQEFFTQYDPDVLLVLDRAASIGSQEQPALEVLNNDLVNRTSAATSDRIVEVEGFSWYIADNAPSSLRQMVADVERTL